MEILAALVELIPTLGFPIVCVIALGAFVFHIYRNTTKENKEAMAAMQERCKEREDKLYEEIKENRRINAEAIATIAKYADRLDVIQKDIDEIKVEVAVIAAK